PIVVALKERNASRAVDLMRTGASEVVPPPWTRENFQACIAKTIRFQGTSFSIVSPVPRRSALYFFFSAAVFFCLAFGYVSLQRQAQQRREALAHKEYWDLPYRHPASIAFDGSDLWIGDWFNQSL